MPKTNIFSYIFFVVFLLANVAFWSHSKSIQVNWLNVPPAPELKKASMAALGDKSLAYRRNALMLQNFGDTGGRTTSLKEYDFSRLKDWFLLEDALDPHSDAVPMMAAYYYGAAKEKEQLNHVLDYLAIVGQRPEGEKWRWLGHAVYLARDITKDHDRALELAYLLAENKSPDLGDWARQLPVFLLQAEGDSELAYKIMLNILIDNVDTMHSTEIFYMKDYICNTILKDQPQIDPPPFCE